ncbi:alpha amylase C-terminal domain-containing protein [Solirubrobacter sp. CPCC 204708]|nr:alpha amylase C-terminal domain-containing protein [Solirubrobacter deserti]
MVLASLFAALLAGTAQAHDRGLDGHPSLRNAVTDQTFYFVMADRFANGSTENDHGGLPPGKDAGQSGFDPTGKGWYHGGDLRGLLGKLDYVQGLGATAIWLTPSFKNKAVQPEDNSAGYHGYWITDFTQIDPHLGSNEDLRALVDAAHRRGIKVYFDIITNHTADVIKYVEGARMPYRSKDQAPYRTASGAPFDDRDHAGTSFFPPLSATTSFPFRPFVPEAERTVKVPAWLNDVTLYHNRGDTTFVGENSLYGDFFGLDDLFTEHPRVVDGMVEIYKTWIREFRIDGFRMDTMKHVNDEFWQTFAPTIERYARSQGIRDFYMFGEVAEDNSRPILSHFTTHDRVQGVLDFAFQTAAMRFAANSVGTDDLRNLFVDDDWFTDGDSNVYNLPTFLGNHDRGRVGMFVRDANPGATEAELLQRDRLAHALMYFSRGNPVVYYGDEQGFTGAGGDQDSRQDMFPSQSPQYNNAADPIAGDDGAGKNDNLGSDETPMDDNFDPGHPLYRELVRLAELTRRHPALRNGTQQHRYSSPAAGVYAFSRFHDREYVVALNNAETAASAAIPTFMARGDWERVYGDGPKWARSGRDARLTLTVPPLSAVVYRARDRIERSRRAPNVWLTAPASGSDRLEVRANVAGSSAYHVTFFARVGHRWVDIGTDDNAPYRVFHDVADLAPGTRVKYRAVVLDNARHERRSQTVRSTVAPPTITLEAPTEGQRVRGTVEVRATAVPEHAHHVVAFERSVDGGPFTRIGSDDSSPVHTAFDDTSSLPDGARVTYRAVLTYAPGRTVTSAARSATIVQARVETAVIHYKGDLAKWGLHLFGDGLPDSEKPEWTNPFPFDEADQYGGLRRIEISDDTKPVGFVVHGRPPTDPNVKDTANDRFFTPLATPEIWLREGDARIYTCAAANDTCVAR